jgi:hypothetical protein
MPTAAADDHEHCGRGCSGCTSLLLQITPSLAHLIQYAARGRCIFTGDENLKATFKDGTSDAPKRVLPNRTMD